MTVVDADTTLASASVQPQQLTEDSTVAVLITLTPRTCYPDVSSLRAERGFRRGRQKIPLVKLGCSLSAETHARMVFAMEAHEGPTTQGRAEDVVAVSRLLFEGNISSCQTLSCSQNTRRTSLFITGIVKHLQFLTVHLRQRNTSVL